MKKGLSLILLIVLCLEIINVKADAGPPMVAEYEVIVTNKDGAACYSYGNNHKLVKTDKKVAFGTVFTVYSEIDNGYLYVNGSDGCDYIYIKDFSAKKDSFDVNSNNVEKITPVKAVILAKGGLNLRKGPSVAYSKIITIPQYKVVTLKYRTGSFWYYAEYNGKSGWITGINQYFGFDNDKILYSYKDINIVDNNEKVIGKIPALTEITDYIELVYGNYDDNNNLAYYVNYNGVKGYIGGVWNSISFKTNGQIKLLADANLYSNGKVTKTVKKGQTFNYSIYDFEEVDTTNGIDWYNIFYLPTEKGYVRLLNNEDKKEFEIINEGEPLKKTKGFIGEGLFGEAKTQETNNEVDNPKPNKDEPTTTPTQTSSNDSKKTLSNEMIIICVLGTVILALTVVIIILLVNKKKDKTVVTKDNTERKNEENNKDLEEKAMQSEKKKEIDKILKEKKEEFEKENKKDVE